MSDGESDANVSDSSDCDSEREVEAEQKTKRTHHRRRNHGQKRKGTTVLRYLQKRMKPAYIMKTLYLGNSSPDLRAKMSIFLRELVNTDFGIILFDELLLPENLQSLYDTVCLFLAFSNVQSTLIRPSSESEFAIKLSQFHLLSSLLTDQIALYFRRFRKYIVEKCRAYSLELSKMTCENPEIREELWQSLMTSQPNDKANLMYMIALSSISNMNRIILGENFVEKANDASKHAIGRRFLLRFIHNDNAFYTTLIFMRKPISPDATFTEYFVMILGYMMSQLLQHLKSYRLVYDTSVLFPIFKETELSMRLSLLIPVAKICCIGEISQRERQTYYQKKLAELCTMIIKAPIDKIGTLKLLLPFSKLQICCDAICAETEFIEDLVNGLYSCVITEFLLSWRLLLNMWRFETIVVCLMKNPIFTQCFGRILDCSGAALENIMELLIATWESPNTDVRDAAAEGMLTKLGLIACLPNHARTRFENRPATIKLVEGFVTLAVSLAEGGTPQQAAFANQLMTHLSSVGIKSHKGTVFLG